MKWVIVIAVIILVFVVYKIIKRVALSSGNSAQKELIIPVDNFKQGETIDECSYSIWFIINEWTNNEKILFTRTSSIDIEKHQEVETYYIVNYTTGETGLYNPVGTTGVTGGVTGTYDFVYYDKEWILNFEVSFDKYVNNMNIFLPELNNSYKKSNNCKVEGNLLGETGSSFEDCKTMCSNYNSDFKTCNSFTITGSSGNPTTNGQSDIYFFTDFDNGVDFEGNQSYDELMGSTTYGKCSIYSSSPVMPKNCFSGMTGKVSPYPVYDWGDFI